LYHSLYFRYKVLICFVRLFWRQYQRTMCNNACNVFPLNVYYNNCTQWRALGGGEVRGYIFPSFSFFSDLTTWVLESLYLILFISYCKMYYYLYQPSPSPIENFWERHWLLYSGTRSSFGKKKTNPNQLGIKIQLQSRETLQNVHVLTMSK